MHDSAMLILRGKIYMSTSIAIAEAAPTSVARGSFALVGTLVARSFGLAAGVAIVLLVAAFLWLP
jgi:hypothetical protein